MMQIVFGLLMIIFAIKIVIPLLFAFLELLLTPVTLFLHIMWDCKWVILAMLLIGFVAMGFGFI